MSPNFHPILNFAFFAKFRVGNEWPIELFEQTYGAQINFDSFNCFPVVSRLNLRYQRNNERLVNLAKYLDRVLPTFDFMNDLRRNTIIFS